jgi:hypothetical protein
MKLDASDICDLRPLIAEAVRSTLDQFQASESKLADRLGFTEAEAAALLGVARHVLRDARLRGEIKARLLGKKYVYSKTTLVAFLNSTK